MTQKSITDFVLRTYRHGALDTERALQQVRQRAGLSPSRRIVALRRWVAAAAVAVLVVVGGIYGYSHRTVTLMAQQGQRVFTLPDGSRATLAPGAMLSYRAHEPRQISMQGKAYFDVVHRATDPFTVQSSHALVHVLGTRFMVSEGSEATQLVVTHGLVGFTTSDSVKPAWIKVAQGHGATLRHGSNMATTDTHTNINATAWATGELHFKATPISEVLSDLSDLYGHQYHCNDTTKRLTATFSTESEAIIVEMIEETLGVDINIGR